MFDVFSYEIKCVKCAAKISEFQTKDLDKSLTYYKKGDILPSEYVEHLKFIRVHTFCDKCSAWYEAMIEVKQAKNKKQDLYKKLKIEGTYTVGDLFNLECTDDLDNL